MPILYGLFFVSGAAGLVYEVLWVRALGNVFGNTVYSASLVTAVFMGGLGIGSYLAGNWVDGRVRDAPELPLRAYGVAELVIAGSAALLAVVLPRLGPIAANLSVYAQDAKGWSEPSFGSLAIRYVGATLLLSVPTMAMGATFTLLVRYALLHRIQDAGFKVGVLYGVNTAGAAAGAYLTDLRLIPALGLLRTQLVAVFAQVVVGVVALVLSSRRIPGAGASVEVARDEHQASAASARNLRAASAALFLSGFAALGIEVAWFRCLGATMGSFRPTLSIVLSLILSGIWLGSTVGGWVERLWPRPVQLLVMAQGLFVLATLGLIATFTRDGTPNTIAFRGAAYVVALPAFLMGFSTPLAHAVAQDAVGHVGRKTGALYLGNTVGAVAGSLFAGFGLASRVGSQTSFVVMAAVAAAAPLPLVLVSSDRSRSMILSLGAGALASIPAIAAWFALPSTYVMQRFLPPIFTRETVLAMHEGVNDIVVVTELPNGSRRLMTNGHPMSATQLVGQRYMRLFAHMPLLMMDRPTSALVICFGVGSTLNATSLHGSLERIDLADLSENVLEHAPYFRASNHDVLSDPRVHVAVNDGRQHLLMQPEATYDLVTLEPPPIIFAGVSALYSREFYEIARSRLKPGGMITQWLPAYQTTGKNQLSMVRAFVDVFPEAALLSGYASEMVLIGIKGPELVLDLDRVEQNLNREPRIVADLQNIEMGSLTELVGTFVGDADTLRRATARALPLTDDRPSLEYTLLDFIRGEQAIIPSSFFELGGIAAFCPKCFDHGAPTERVAWLPDYQRALERIYTSKTFLASVDPIVADLSGLADTVNRSPYLRDAFGARVKAADVSALRSRVATAPGDAPAHHALAFALLKSGLTTEALAEQRVVVDLTPTDPEAHYDLAVLELTLGQAGDATAEAQKAVDLSPDYALANAMLCQALEPDDLRKSVACKKAQKL
jgi:spermidine synthase